MAKSKQGPALLELMKGTRPDRGDAPGNEPGSAARRTAPAQAGGREDEPSATSRGLDEAAHHPTALDSEPACEVIGNRIRFSLTQRSATVIVGIAGIVLIGACLTAYRLGETRGKEMGRRTVQEGVLTEIERARSSTPTRNLFDGIGEDPTTALVGANSERSAEDPAAVVGEAYGAPDEPWVPGYNYIVVQDFRSDARGDAIRARDFLEENGLRCAITELEQSEVYRYRLITVTGFNLDDAVQKTSAREYLDRVHRLGQAYSESGGRYDFKSAYFKKLTGERW